MKKIPIIGIVGTYDNDKKLMNMPRTNEVGENYIKIVNEHGAIPIGIYPPQDIFYTDLTSKEIPELTFLEKEKLTKAIDLCDGIILPGGNRWYEYDEFICQYAHENNIPLIGICRGMQIMAYVDRKYKLDKPKTFKNETNINHHVLGEKYVHNITIKDDSKLFLIIGENNISVNSRHNYNIGSGDDFSSLKVSAISDDGIIEAIEDPNAKFYLGIQWHPELMDLYDFKQANLIKEFIDIASE